MTEKIYKVLTVSNDRNVDTLLFLLESALQESHQSFSWLELDNLSLTDFIMRSTSIGDPDLVIIMLDGFTPAGVDIVLDVFNLEDMRGRLKFLFINSLANEVRDHLVITKKLPASVDSIIDHDFVKEVLKIITTTARDFS